MINVLASLDEKSPKSFFSSVSLERQEEIYLPDADAVGQVLADSGRRRITKCTVFDFFNQKREKGKCLLLERLNAATVSGSTPRMCPTHCRLSRMPSGDFCYVAPRGGTPSMISATELVQIAAPARSTGFVTFSGSLGSAKVFRAEPHEARYGCVKGRASGQLFLAASRTSAAISA